MTLLPAIESSRLSVLLDVRYPQAYLALHPAAALGRELAVEINWLPVVVSTLSPPSRPGPDDDRGIRHRRYRAQAIAREIATYADAQGLVLRDYYRSPDPAAFSSGWLWVRDRKPEVLESFLSEGFRAYWAVELDPSNDAQVAKLVDAVGADAAGFRAWCADDGPLAVATLNGQLRGLGVFGTPSFLLEDQYFLGRQHLPMIRWMLEGRSGPVPI